MFEEHCVLGSGLSAVTANPMFAGMLELRGVCRRMEYLSSSSVTLYNLKHTRLSKWFLFAVHLSFPLNFV